VRPAIVLFASSSLLFALPVHAFSRSTVPTGPLEADGPCLFWRARTVPFVLNEAGSASAGSNSSLEAARASFRTWTQPSCTDFRFEEQPVTSSVEVGFDQNHPSANTNLVVWREVACSEVVPSDDPCLEEGGCNNLYNCWEHSPATIGVTTTTFSNRTGEIFDADIEMNGAYFDFSTVDMPVCPRSGPTTQPPTCVATDIENTLVHEIGHVIGLDHVLNLPSATMYLSAQYGETDKRTLEEDDIEGVCSIYPAGAPTVTCVQEEVDAKGGCACSSAPDSAWWLGALWALVLVRRRRAPG